MRKALIIIAFVISLLGIQKTSQTVNPEFCQIIGVKGYWRIVQDDRKVWWFLSPDNKKEFLTSVTSVNPFQIGKRAPHYLSKDYHIGDDKWAKETAIKVQQYGFKGVGAWSHPKMMRHLPYTMDLNILAACKFPIESEEWINEVNIIIEKQIAPIRGEKNLVGYYLDNELDWVALEPHARRYFKAVFQAIRRIDTVHLILGVRFNHRPSISVLEASVGFVDAHSFNTYTDDAVLWKNMMKEAYAVTNRPVILAEFSFYSDKNNSGNRNSRGFGGLVKDQQERATCYSKIVEGSADTSFMIGTEWFQWNDEPPFGRTKDGEDCNFGIVDIFDSPYPLLVQSIRETSSKVNDIHKRSDDFQKNKVWRDDPMRIKNQ